MFTPVPFHWIVVKVPLHPLLVLCLHRYCSAAAGSNIPRDRGCRTLSKLCNFAKGMTIWQSHRCTALYALDDGLYEENNPLRSQRGILAPDSM